MSTLSAHTSSNTEVLHGIFGSAWMDLFIAVVWEVLDKQDPSAVALSKKFWGFTVKVTYGEITWVFEHLFGARP